MSIIWRGRCSCCVNTACIESAKKQEQTTMSAPFHEPTVVAETKLLSRSTAIEVEPISRACRFRQAMQLDVRMQGLLSGDHVVMADTGDCIFWTQRLRLPSGAGCVSLPPRASSTLSAMPVRVQSPVGRCQGSGRRHDAYPTDEQCRDAICQQMRLA
jgi:hypothetical protein